MSKTALVTGASGQDGSYLTELLLERGYHVHAQSRGPAGAVESRPAITWHTGDIADSEFLKRLIGETSPDEIYNLAAITRPGLSWQYPEQTAVLNALVPQRICGLLAQTGSSCRLFQASTSEMFDGEHGQAQSETTPFNPQSPYGISKAFAHRTVGAFRKQRGLHASCGILFNHESPRRGLSFVSQKIAHAAAAISLGMRETRELDEHKRPIVAEGKLHLGNIHVRRDFGFAGDVAAAMHLIVTSNQPDDYIIGTGESRSIAQFCEQAFRHVGLDWEHHVVVDRALERNVDTPFTQADASKLTARLGWKPKVSFDALVEMMVNERIRVLRGG
ncbi:GDP-mannose 4,6-dehydratase [Tardiphaga sp.]|uniref:GDP-mannose 4,6-dehydratase n=1 Tax=Tardiphaga sp. TaxID=1926292 RepID=UPI00352B697E